MAGMRTDGLTARADQPITTEVHMTKDTPGFRPPRPDDKPLWDVMFAVYGYPALLIAHRLKVFSLLETRRRIVCRKSARF